MPRLEDTRRGLPREDDGRDGPAPLPSNAIGVAVQVSLTLKYDRKRIRFEVNDLTRGLVGKYVDVYEMPDGRIQVRAKGVALPCSIFDPHQQRVSHAAITENKHLSAVLAHIKEEQEKAVPPPKVKPVSAKNGYKKSGRRPPGRPSKMEAYYERRRKERAAEASTAVND